MEQKELRDILLLPLLERERKTREVPKDRRYLVVLLAFVVVVAAAAGFFLMQNRNSVPQVVGLSEANARLALERIGIRTRIENEKYSSEPKGQVLEQSPEAGTLISRLGSVSLVLSAGTGEVIVPELIGENQVYATSQLESRGLVPLIIEVSSSRPPGSVVRLEPAAGSTLVTGDAVTVMISAQTEVMPLKEYDLSGKKVAIVALSDLGIEKDVIADLNIRLSSLLEASDAEVNSYDNYRMFNNAIPQFDLGIILSLRDDRESSGIELRSFDASATTDFASNINGSFRTSAYELQLSPWEKLMLPSLDAAHQAELNVGNIAHMNDVSKLNEDAYLDLIARALYIGIGETIGK